MRNIHLADLNKLELERQVIFRKLEAVNESILLTPPRDNKWSILQILYHLLRSEELSLLYLQKKLKYESNIFRENFFSRIRFVSFIWILRLAIPLPAPKRVSEFPDSLNWPDIKKRYAHVRAGFGQILTDLPDKYLDKLLYYHPSAGRLTLSQMFRFFMIHTNRHYKQIDNILKGQKV